jgi:catechol 2,3-dioxygenase-like lactoylglutathione lyase family enzyme
MVSLGEHGDAQMAAGLARGKLEIWHIAHPVADLDRSVAFYCDYLGFELVGRDEYPDMRQAFVSLGKGGFTIELFVPLGERASKPRRVPDHLAFESIDLRAYREGVVRAGLPVPQIEVFEGGMQHFALDDPDGLRLDFFEGRDGYETYISGNRS